jgi:hypothetical protein
MQVRSCICSQLFAFVISFSCDQCAAGDATEDETQFTRTGTSALEALIHQSAVA